MDSSLPDPLDEANPWAVCRFEEHLDALADMFELMIGVGLKMKLSKCFFC